MPSTPDTPLVVSNDYPLSRVDNFKYLGVTLSADFTWDKHIMSISYKARKLIGMLFRNFYKFSNQNTSLNLVFCVKSVPRVVSTVGMKGDAVSSYNLFMEW